MQKACIFKIKIIHFTGKWPLGQLYKGQNTDKCPSRVHWRTYCKSGVKSPHRWLKCGFVNHCPNVTIGLERNWCEDCFPWSEVLGIKIRSSSTFVVTVLTTKRSSSANLYSQKGNEARFVSNLFYLQEEAEHFSSCKIFAGGKKKTIRIPFI